MIQRELNSSNLNDTYMGSQISLPTEAFPRGHFHQEFLSKASLPGWRVHDKSAKRMLEVGEHQGKWLPKMESCLDQGFLPRFSRSCKESVPQEGDLVSAEKGKGAYNQRVGMTCLVVVN